MNELWEKATYQKNKNKYNLLCAAQIFSLLQQFFIFIFSSYALLRVLLLKGPLWSFWLLGTLWRKVFTSESPFHLLSFMFMGVQVVQYTFLQMASYYSTDLQVTVTL